MGNPERSAIRSYEQIRRILRILFVYECYSSKEIQKILGISEKTYKNILANIRTYLGPEAMEITKRKREDVITFSSEMFEANWNRLMESYMSKAFGRSNMGLTLLYLQILHAHYMESGKDGLSFSQIQSEADPLMKGDHIIDPRTGQKILQNLIDLDYLTLDACGEYRLSPEILTDFSLDTKKNLLMAIDFFSNLHYPAVCGKYCFDTLNRQILQEDPAPYETPFLMKNNHFAHVLDDEILFDLLEAIHVHRMVTFTYCDQQGACRQMDRQMPLHITVDEFLGRRYVLTQGTDGFQRLYRLDRISELKTETHRTDPVRKSGKEIWDQKMRYSLYATQITDKPAKKVRLWLRDRQIRSVVHRLFCVEREVSVKDGAFHTTILMDFPLELKPWLRQHMGKVRLLSCEGSDLARQMDDELREWREMYGIVL